MHSDHVDIIGTDATSTMGGPPHSLQASILKVTKGQLDVMRQLHLPPRISHLIQSQRTLSCLSKYAPHLTAHHVAPAAFQNAGLWWNQP